VRPAGSGEARIEDFLKKRDILHSLTRGGARWRERRLVCRIRRCGAWPHSDGAWRQVG
jgi:hypothetical protein